MTSGAGAADPGIVASTMGDTPAPTTTGTTPDLSSQPAGDATAGADVQGATETTTTEEDILAGVPSLDELNQLDDNLQYKKSLVQMRQAIEQTFKPQLSEQAEKLKIAEPILDRFQTSEELQAAVEWHDKLFGAYERDDRGQLVPATEKAAQDLAQRDPLVADYLAADLMNGLTRTDDGREIPRIDLALEEMARDPQRRAQALKLLGGVEPTSIAPTWQPTAEELEVVRPELQDIYKQLPYDERESLKLNDPEFINKYLAKEKFQADLMRENETAKELQARQQEQREQYFNQQAEMAGNKAVEEGFRQGMSEFTQSVVERAKFIAPLDPQSPEAQKMAPEQVTQFNQVAQQINTGVGKMIATVTAALSFPDTAWVAMDFLKEIGVPEQTLQAFDNARLEYARNTRDYGELNFRGSQNGNGHAGLGALQSNSQRAMRAMKGQANAVSKPLFEMMSKFFEMKAGNYNSTLNGAATVRPPVNGTGFNPATAPAQRPPAGTYSRREIDAMFG